MPTKKNINNTLTIKHAKQISELMLEKKALNIKIIDVRKITTLTDFFIICTSESQPQTRAITEHVKQKMKEKKINVWHVEGYEHLDWVLMDYVNIVVHIFNAETREYYALERLWADGKVTLISDEK